MCLGLEDVDVWLRVQWFLRQRYFSKGRWRKGLPAVGGSDRDFAEEVFYRSLVRVLPVSVRCQVCTIVDVGSRNGSYLGAFGKALFEHPEKRVIALEVDGGRRFWNGYTRADYLQAHVMRQRQLGEDMVAHCEDVRTWKLEQPLRGPVLWVCFYPFVSPFPCHRWGLPSSFADYASLLKALIDRSPKASPAWLLSAHQGEEERCEALSIYSSLGWKAGGLHEVTAPDLEAGGSFDVGYFPTTLWWGQIA